MYSTELCLVFTLDFDPFRRRATPSVLRMIIAINITTRIINNNHIIEYLRANKLTLNVTKTDFLLIVTSQKLSHIKEVPTITVNDTPVNPFLSEFLSWFHLIFDVAAEMLFVSCKLSRKLYRPIHFLKA